jgi:hypothetical protein
MVWKMALSQIVAMVMLAAVVLVARDCVKKRDAARLVYALLPLTVMIWAVYLMLNEHQAIDWKERQREEQSQ